MKIFHKMILAGLTIFLMSSCSSSLVPFTQQLRQEHQLTPEEMKSLQFYISNTFVLRRGEQLNKKETIDGELTLLKDGKVEEIVIKAGTRCVIKDVVDGSRVTISFEENGNKFLVFGSINNRDGYYTLQAFDWVKGKGQVNYGEQTYYSSAGSKDVFLAIKMKSLEQLKVDQKVVKGKKVN